MSAVVVRRIVRLMDREPPRPVHGPSTLKFVRFEDVPTDEVKKAFAEGETLRSMAQRFGLSKERMGKLLRKLGLVRPKAGSQPGSWRSIFRNLPVVKGVEFKGIDSGFVQAYSLRTGMKFITRTTEDGVRVWRIE